jgi:4-diphosphocytidyl-2-C-methyl-D-erythritol kinase
MRRRISTCCPAKLNLALAVGAPRGDGFHPIASWMVTVDFVDDLAVTMLDPGDLSRYAIFWDEKAPQQAEIDWSIRDDLAVRAHRAMERHVDRPLPVQMKLEKRIPVGGGLGGGSSNAAGMLRALNQLFALNLGGEALNTLAASIGSDVPFFLHGGSALVRGLGESIEPHPQPPVLSAVLVLPPFACPTGAVYKAFDTQPMATFQDAEVEAQFTTTPDGASFFNDLAAPAMIVEPALRDIHDRLIACTGGPVHLSGSGSTLFIPCSDSMHAATVAAAVHDQLDVPAVAVTTCTLTPDLLETVS